MSDVEIQAQVQRFLSAYRANDLAKYFGCVADDATVTIGGKGRASKQLYQGMWTSVVSAGGGVVSADIEDLQVRVGPSGDAGVASFVMNAAYRGMVPGEPDKVLQKKLVLTEVWFKSGDQWRIAHIDWFDAPASA